MWVYISPVPLTLRIDEMGLSNSLEIIVKCRCHRRYDKIFLKIIFGCIVSLLLCAGFSLVVASGGYSSLQCTGFSLRCLLLLWSTSSRRAGFSSCSTRALERGLSNCGIRAQCSMACGNLPRPGLEPVSPALAGGFSTSAPPGKPP